MNTATPSSPPEPPFLRAADERLVAAQAFRRFVMRVSLAAPQWLRHFGVPEADRDDAFQDALLQMYLRRESYDPAVASWESWAFGFVGCVARNYRKSRAIRFKRLGLSAVALPDVASDEASPEEETAAAMMKALVDKCMANLDNDSRAALHASAKGVEMADIAAALGLSLPGAYTRVRNARARLQANLDREQKQKRALGVMVLPLTIDQLLASDTTTAHFSPETMRQIWKTLDRVMAADMAAGKLRDDGTEVERYMGSPNVAAPRARLRGRILRTLGPRTLAALTHVGAAAVGAGVVYLLMRHAPTPPDTTADARAATSVVADVESSRDPAPSETAATTTGVSGLPELPELPELRAVELSADAGAGPSAAGRDDTAGEQSFFDRGNTAFQSGYYENAIKVLREHAIKYPRGPYSAARERLFTLALIRAGRKAEARPRIERLRQANPASALLAEFDAAMNANGP